MQAMNRGVAERLQGQKRGNEEISGVVLSLVLFSICLVCWAFRVFQREVSRKNRDKQARPGTHTAVLGSMWGLDVTDDPGHVAHRGGLLWAQGQAISNGFAMPKRAT